MYTTVFNICNNNELVEHQIRMISDWRFWCWKFNFDE